MKTSASLGLIAWSAATLLATSKADAEPATLMLVGELAGSEESDMRNAAQHAIEAAGWSVVESELSAQASSQLLVCLHRPSAERESCLSGFVQKTPAERAVVLRVTTEMDDGKKSRVVSGWVFRRSGRTLAFNENWCRGCRSAGLARTAAKLVAEVILDARSAAAPSALAIRSRPPGARITLDGRVIGATDTKVSVYPGRHVLRLEKDGYKVATRELVIDDGEHAAVDVVLAGQDGAVVADTRPASSAEPAPESRESPPEPSLSTVHKPESTPPGGRTQLVPWLLVAGGGAAVLTGSMLLILDEGDSFDADGKLQQQLDKPFPLAIGLAAAGGVALGAGFVLLWRTTGDDGKPEPVVAVERGATWVGVRGVF